jgi:hypothetical protein
MTLLVPPPQVAENTTLVTAAAPGPGAVGRAARVVIEDVNVAFAVGLTQVPPTARAAEGGGLVGAVPRAGSADDGDTGSFVAGGEVGPVVAAAGAGDGELGAASHPARTAIMMTAASALAALDFILASLSDSRGGSALAPVRSRWDAAILDHVAPPRPMVAGCCRAGRWPGPRFRAQVRPRRGTSRTYPERHGPHHR